jgi:hypothetical protein
MLDILSLDPVSKIRLAFRRPEIARQACPGASPYRLPVGDRFSMGDEPLRNTTYARMINSRQI